MLLPRGCQNNPIAYNSNTCLPRAESCSSLVEPSSLFAQTAVAFPLPFNPKLEMCLPYIVAEYEPSSKPKPHPSSDILAASAERNPRDLLSSSVLHRLEQLLFVLQPI